MSGERFARGGAGRLMVAQVPVITTFPSLPEHRVLRVHLRNEGEQAVVVHRSQLRLLDDHGHDLRAASRPSLVRLEPSGEAAFDLAYRVRGGEGAPARLEHAEGSLPLPVTTAHPA